MNWWSSSSFFDQIMGLVAITLFLLSAAVFSIMYFCFRDKPVRYK
mgnify:FL=1